MELREVRMWIVATFRPEFVVLGSRGAPRYRCWQLRNRAPSAGPTWPVRTWSATGRCFRAGRPATATPRRTRDAQSRYHCMQIPVE